MDGLTHEQTQQFLRGYFAALRNEPIDHHETPEWKDGYAFRVQVMAEKAERRLQCRLH